MTDIKDLGSVEFYLSPLYAKMQKLVEAQERLIANLESLNKIKDEQIDLLKDIVAKQNILIESYKQETVEARDKTSV